MQQTGVILQVKPLHTQFVSPIFAKEEPEKFRPIVNFKGLNEHIEYQILKMETLTDVKDTLRQNDWMVKIDLKDAFLSVPMRETMAKRGY